MHDAPDKHFLINDFEPAYLQLLRTGRLAARAAQALEELADCVACPRNCHINRLTRVPRICRTGRYAIVSSAFPHHGEEPCLRGSKGSGTIFFSNCNLRCVFCQNCDISQVGTGRSCSGDELAAMMLSLQSGGCHNINFVTPEHVVPQMIEAVYLAASHGLNIPIVYNTSAYDCIPSLRLLEGIVDIYMPDFKFWDRNSSKLLLKAKDYPQRARHAISEMHRQVGPLKLARDGIARRGVLVRHLVMPGQLQDSAAIFDWLAGEVSRHTFINIMGQYRPMHLVGKDDRYEQISRPLRASELEDAVAAARRAGLYRFA